MFGFEVYIRDPLTIYETGLVAITVIAEHFHGSRAFAAVMKNY
jgi:hypothetical protein